MATTIRTIAAALAACCGTAAAAAVDYSTLTQWTGPGGNGHYYALTDAPGTWTGAHADATAAGGHLASVGSAEENAFIGTAFGFANTIDSIYWIGFYRPVPHGAFEWTDGSAITYTNWNGGEPNDATNVTPDGEQYTAINWYAFNQPGGNGPLGTWNDAPNGGVFFSNPTPQPYRGVVEFTTAPVPEPTTWATMILGFGLTGAVLRWRRSGFQTA